MKKGITFLSASALIILGIGIYSKNKISKIEKAFNSLKATLTDIKNIDFGWEKTKIKVNVSLFNNSLFDLKINTFNMLKIKQFQIFEIENNNLLGYIEKEISEVEINSKEEIILKDIEVILSPNKVLDNIELFTGGNLESKIKTVIVYELNGNIYKTHS